jgi:hypothetical protein
MDKRFTVPKWVLIVLDLSAQFVCPGPKILDLNEKRLHWASVVRGIAGKKVTLKRKAFKVMKIKSTASLAVTSTLITSRAFIF